MSAVLKRLAQCASTVEVEGEKVVLRWPTDTQRMWLLDEMKRVGEIETDADRVRAARTWHRCCARMLEFTVDDENMSADDWSRLITASNTEPEKHDDLVTLLREAMRLCGFNAPEDGDAPTTDHVAEVDAALGDRPT